MENTRRKEPPLWLNTAVHVWITKNDIPVVNLRDVSEKLRLPRSALRADETAPTSDEEMFQAESASSNDEKPPEQKKQDPFNAILALMKRCSEKQGTPQTQRPAVTSIPLASGTNTAKEPEPKAPSFPEPKPAKAMDVEFVQGVNLPGEKNTTAPIQVQPEVVKSVALFHDPVWGEAESSYNVGSLAPKEEEKHDILASLKFGTFTDGAKERESSSTEVPASTAAPPPFTASTPMSEMMYQPPPHPAAVASSSPQIAYPQGVGLGASGWATAPPPGHGMAVHPLQFVGVPLPFIPSATVMAMPQPYSMPYQVYQMHPPAPPLASVPRQPAAYQVPPTSGAFQLAAQKLVNQQSAEPRPGTNVGATPFVPGAKGS
ncbi:hypothetical protein TraAM80_03827 [Trypanosoma rangeli]|uniref:Uncharacterized protein n=1 Tax=Trypanosoma rangeli TaxID=5698 RepID=A0A422NME0_TRYRA|nr:uncharacterized protein TraAM80_03827 [Trypanosoma rangeli]RNF06631.1 hypothetical protein TraAM80_03827 [Trypanosoma rangeli]|eukprot:RNF06631.1 hypothetical protein TraAM80_03827 [Trypanosoma rangeli]